MPVPCSPEELVIERVHFSASGNRLEGELVYREEGQPIGAVVLAGPHPLLGGTMHNNVIQALGNGLAERDMLTLRFNYRGVGGSEGPTGDLSRHLAEFWQSSHISGEEELAENLAGAADFLRCTGGDVSVVLAGYSFGCTLLPTAIPVDRPTVLVLIAPTVGTHDLDTFLPLPQPKLIIAPENDFATNEQHLTDWFHRLAGPCEMLRPQLDGHFFRGHEGWLCSTVGEFLDRQWGKCS